MYKFLLWFIFVSANPIIAQNAWTVYNSSNSQLPENSVRCIAEDLNNIKWIGTDYGLTAFDGITWTVYQTFNSGIPDNSIRSIAIDAFNNKWIGTFNGGLAKFDGTTWIIFNTFNSDLPDDYVRSLAVDAFNNLWVGTIGGLSYFDGVTWTTYDNSNSILMSNNISALYLDTTSNVLGIGTINGGFLINDNGSWSIFTLSNSSIPDNTILDIDKDTSGVWWLSTPASGITGYVGGITFVTFNTLTSSIPTNSTSCLTVLPDQNIYIGSTDSGLIKKNNLSFSGFTNLNSPLPDNYIQSLLLDNSGFVWIGTQTGGLVRLDDSLLSGIHNENTDYSVTIFPNPARDFFNVVARNNNRASISIFSLTGILVREKIVLDNETIDITNLPGGTYILKIILCDNLKISRKLIVIK